MAWRNESAYKTALVKEIRAAGGYARRIEDQFAVGVPDIVCIGPGIGTVFVEAKIVRSDGFAATPRQRVEATRITGAGGRSVLIAYDKVTGFEYVFPVTDNRVRISDATRRHPGEPFLQFLERYFNGG